MELQAITFDFNAADLISPSVIAVVAGGLLWLRSYLARLLRSQHDEAMTKMTSIEIQTIETNGRVRSLEMFKARQEGVNESIFAMMGKEKQ